MKTVRNLQSRIGINCTLRLFTVVDGHAGDRAAKYIVSHLTETFWTVAKSVLFDNANASKDDDDDDNTTTRPTTTTQPKQKHSTPTEEVLFCSILKQTLSTIDKNWLNEMKNTRINDGACVLVCLLVDDCRWYFAHLGDCRAVFVRGTKAISITKDHTPDPKDKRETARIALAGGKVVKKGAIYRVCAGGTKIAVTRAIGDKNMKRLRDANDTPVLSSEADTNVLITGQTVSGSDGSSDGNNWTMVLVSDGVTCRMKNKAIASCLRTATRLDSVKSFSQGGTGNGVTKGSTKDEENGEGVNLAQVLVERAYQNGSFDNISAVVIRPQ